MENLDKIDGACEYFYLLEKENEEADVKESQETLPNELPNRYPQKHMYKAPKIDNEKYQIEIDKNLYRGNKEKYLATELQVYGTRKRSNSEEFIKNKI